VNNCVIYYKLLWLLNKPTHGGILLKLTVLGNYGPYPKAGGACSGFLLTSDNSNILIDCGSGVVSKLQQHIDIEELDAVILSHLHSDHAGDMLTLGYAVDIKLKKQQMKESLKVYLPGEPADEFERIASRPGFEASKIDESLILKIKDVEIVFKEMKHGYQNYAISIQKGNRRFVYSGDTMPNEDLIKFAKDADLFLCEAGLLERDEKLIRAMHLTAKEAGEIAEKAGAKRLLLTHFLPDINVQHYMNEAASVYNGIMEIAGESKTYYI
jgi:ribonuclease BN (tRNA processing enzyme)